MGGFFVVRRRLTQAHHRRYGGDDLKLETALRQRAHDNAFDQGAQHFARFGADQWIG